MTDKEDVLREAQAATTELRALLDDFSVRLRRMRQRNRHVEEEIASFEAELERLRAHLVEETQD